MSDTFLKNSSPEYLFLSPKEAGLLVGYTADYVSKLSRDGAIHAKRDGRGWLVEKSSLENFAKRIQGEEKKRLALLQKNGLRNIVRVVNICLSKKPRCYSVIRQII